MSVSPALSILKSAIPFSQFSQIDFRIGQIISAENFEKARNPSYKIKVDFGTDGIKQSAAQLPFNYKINEVYKKFVVCITNLSPRKIAGFSSEILIVGFPDVDHHVFLLNTRGRDLQLGLRLSTDESGTLKPVIQYDTFTSADIRCGTITSMTPMEVDPCTYRVVLNMGELGEQASVLPDIDADIAKEVLGTQVAVLINLKRECIDDWGSHILAFSHLGKNIPLGVDKPVDNGVALF